MKLDKVVQKTGSQISFSETENETGQSCTKDWFTD